MIEPVLEVNRLIKKIGSKWIIEDVSFTVSEGEIFGFLGPNGSGKTTTIRMLVDLIRPTSGEIKICGKHVRREHDEAMRQVGSIVENPELYGYMSGWENLEHFANMLPDTKKDRIAEVVSIVGMEQRIHDKVKTYSLGMRQRLGIAQALLGKPKLLILDEPTNGLDPQGIKELRQFIVRLAEQGLSLFISSHLLSEIQMLCDRVAIILRGRVLAVGEVDKLLEAATRYVEWRVNPQQTARRIMDQIQGLQLVETHPPSTIDEFEAIGCRVDPVHIPEVNQRLVEAGVQVQAIDVRQPSLEDLFFSLTEGEAID